MHKYAIKKRFPSGPLISDIQQIYDAPEEREMVVPVKGAKVVIADYRLLIHDFSDVFNHASFRAQYWDYSCEDCRRTGCGLCHSAIDCWLVDNAAFVSAKQTISNSVNSPISGGTPVKRGYRPPKYGRALVMPIDECVSERHARYIDIKGAGVAEPVTPTHKRHSNGLDYVGIALADFFYAWLVDVIFARTVPSYSVVPMYAVIDLGFEITGGLYGTAPAGLHVRRAHFRNRGVPIYRWRSDAEMIALHMEMILRSFGLTSTGSAYSLQSKVEDGREYLQRSGGFIVKEGAPEDRGWYNELLDIVRGRRMDIINVQFANGVNWKSKIAQIVDFGLFHAGQRFDMPFATQAVDRPFLIGRTILPNDPSFTLPVKEIAVDTGMVNRATVNGVSFYVAQAFRSGIYSRSEIEAIFRMGVARTWPKNVPDR